MLLTDEQKSKVADNKSGNPTLGHKHPLWIYVRITMLLGQYNPINEIQQLSNINLMSQCTRIQ